ncbi:alpha/beta hydrolase [Levilactobacillus angrenensis]|uniref:Alpha/beta hydrolase n=1 Tax=Levilactobacillus angrenensis TaxID=2486020 RepID=A0ABW1U7C0_9LACO|nr:alpha/beta hydrolase [Levilactobacillus angrenensis]
MKIFNFTLGQPDFPVTVTYYQPAAIADFNQPPRRPLVILLPGGGYRFYSDRENEIVALQYLAAGYAVAVVAYRLIDQPPVYPTALYQLAQVVAAFHRHAETYAIDAQRILLVGFSAGGHLAALYADLWPQLAQTCRVPSRDCAVQAVVLAYPVIGLRLGWPPDSATRQAISGTWDLTEADQLVTSQNPPAFVWTTATDELVPPQNAQAYVQALQHVGVPVAFHLYPRGPHALSLARSITAFPAGTDQDPTFGARYVEPEVATWFPAQLAWLQRVLG